MARITALQLINRVLLYRRQPEISAYQATSPEHAATLNALNMAKEDILAPRRYEFDLRHDGQLATKASLSSGSLSPTLVMATGSTSGVLTFSPGTLAEDYLNGDYVARLIPTGDDDYSDTAFRVISSLPSFNVATLNFPFASPKPFVSTTCDMVYSEYLLPDTVREVVRASYEQEELSLDQIDSTARFDELFPSYTYDTGYPRSFNVGGYDTGTHFTTTDPDPKLRAIVWPIPDDEYIITYSYYYRHPDFTDGDSELVGVPPEIVNEIVFQATAIMGMAWDNNFSAAHFSDMAQQGATIKGNLYSGSSSRRHTVRSWGTGDFFDASREGFPGKLIGDV